MITISTLIHFAYSYICDFCDFVELNRLALFSSAISCYENKSLVAGSRLENPGN